MTALLITFLALAFLQSQAAFILSFLAYRKAVSYSPPQMVWQPDEEELSEKEKKDLEDRLSKPIETPMSRDEHLAEYERLQRDGWDS